MKYFNSFFPNALEKVIEMDCKVQGESVSKGKPRVFVVFNKVVVNVVKSWFRSEVK